uniref:Late endosomal/lysosomal adaptor and MAPK and MTOR activator 5 n=1 Tax=Globodera pallida TaxID=36090 RepID=A0A183CF34_GLOPA
MEKRMEECADEIMSQDPSVRGVLCTDSNGMLFCARGSLADDGTAAHSAAVASQLANLAVALEPNAQPLAIILSRTARLSVPTTGPLPSHSLPLTSPTTTTASSSHPATDDDFSKVLIKRSGAVTVALHK